MPSIFYGFILLAVAITFIMRTVKVVPQLSAWIIERLGKYHATLNPGLNFLVPFIDKVAYRHSLKEIPLDVPSQICITRDNTQLQVDGILYFQVTDAMRASYGSSNYVMAITQLAQTTLRSVIGRLELDRTFEERDSINAQVVNAIDEAALNWGVKVLRYEIKDLTPPADILRAMQAQITAEREKRAVIATSEGKRQEQINLADGQKQAAIAKSEGEQQAQINNAQGEAAAILAVAEATAQALERVGQAIRQPGRTGRAAQGGRTRRRSLWQSGAGCRHHAGGAFQHDRSFCTDHFGHENGAIAKAGAVSNLLLFINKKTAAMAAVFLWCHRVPVRHAAKANAAPAPQHPACPNAMRLWRRCKAPAPEKDRQTPAAGASANTAHCQPGMPCLDPCDWPPSRPMSAHVQQ